MNALLSKNLISTKEAAELSGYSPDYLARLARSGEVEGTQVGRTWLIGRESLMRLLKSKGRNQKELAGLVSTKEASKEFGYSPDYLARLARSGEVEGARVGRTWLVQRESLAKFLADQSERKEAHARALAHAREKEYRRHQTRTPFAQPVAVSQLVSPIWTSTARAFVVAMLVVGTAFAASQTLTLPSGARVAEFANEFSIAARSGRGTQALLAAVSQVATSPISGQPTRPASFVGSVVALGERTALLVYHTINGGIDASNRFLAMLFGPRPVLVIQPPLFRNGGRVSTTTTTTKTITTTIIRGGAPSYNTYVQGVSKDFVYQSLSALRFDILNTVQNTVNPIARYSDTGVRSTTATSITLTTSGTSGAATFDGTTLNIPQYTSGGGSGTVTSVALSVPTGLSVSGSPVTTSGTLAVSLTSGYTIPLVASTTEWDAAYSNRITSATSPLAITNHVLSISPASATTNGYLTSTDWNTFNNKFATTSSNYWLATYNKSFFFSTTSADYWGSTKGYLTSALTGLKHSFGATQTGATQTFATSSDTNIGLTITNLSADVFTFTPTWIGTLADSRIASAATWNAKQAALSFTYPLVNLANTVSLAFGTSTSNTWGGTQTFTNAPRLGSLTGVIYGNGGTLATVATSAPAAGTGISLSGTGAVVGGSLTITNTGVTSAQTLYGATQTGAIKFATSSTPINNDWDITNTGTTFLFNLPTATGLVRGLLSANKFAEFDAKQAALAFTYPLRNIANTISLAFGTTTANSWSSLQQFNGNASTTALTVSGSTWLTSITGTTQCLRVDTNGKVSGTGADCGTGSAGVTTIQQTYGTTQNGALTFATSTATSFNGLTISNKITNTGTTFFFAPPTVTGTLSVAGGGTGATSFTAGQLLYGSGTGALSSVATSTLAVGNGLTVTSGSLGYQVGGSNVSVGLASIAANRVLGTTGAAGVPTAVTATSTFYSTTPGKILAYLGGQWTGVATTTFSSGLTYANGNVTNTGLLSLRHFSGSAQTGAIILATSTTAINNDWGITNTAGTFTFNLPTATASIRGLLSSTDWSTFNSKQAALAFTYPLVNLANTVSLAFGTTTANTWGAHNIFTSLFATNASTTNATTTSQYITSLTSQLLRTDGAGQVRGTTIGSGLSFDGTTLSSTGSSFAWPFTKTTYGVSTSTTVGFTLGILSTASSTFTSSVRFSSLTPGGAAIGAGGLLYSAATTTAGTGLTYSANAFNVNTTQNIAKLSNLTSNGFVKTINGDGTLSIDTSTYLTTAITGFGAQYSAVQTGATQTVASSTTGTDFKILSTGDTTTFYLPTASASARGLLSSTDWSTFNAKQAALAFTYPLVNLANTVSLAFGTSTSNTWGGTQTFTNTPILGSLTGLIYGNGGNLNTVATSAPVLASEFSYSGTLGTLVGGVGGTLALATNGVALTKLAQIAANTILGNPTGALGNVQAFATSSLGIALSDTSGTLQVNRGGTGATSFTAGQLLYGSGTGALSSVATSTLAVGNGLTVTSGSLGYQVGGSNVSVGLASIAANRVLGTTGAAGVPTAVTATSTFYSTTPGKILAYLGGQWTGVATTTFSSGLTYANGNVTNTGVLSLAHTYGSAQTGALTFATSTATSFNGLTISNKITNTGTTFIFAPPTITGTLGEAGGGTNQSTYTKGDTLYASAANTLSKLAIGTPGFILAALNGVPTWVASTTLATISGTLNVAHGGTGQTTFTVGQLLYGNDTNALSSVATTTFTPSAEFTTTGTIGALVGGANSTLSLATNGVALTKLAQIAANTILGNPTGALGNVQAFATSTLGIAISDTTGTLAVSRGGTGATTLTGLLQGNGTGAITGISNSSTVGQVLRVTGAATYAWGGLDLGDGDAITGVLPIANGGTNNSSAYTAGSVVFSNGTSLTQDNANFFWNDSTNRLGIGTSSPTRILDIFASNTQTNPTFNSTATIAITNTNTTTGNFASLQFLTNNTAGGNREGSRISGIFDNHTVNAVAGSLAFITSNEGGLTEHARLTYAGNFGIGTSTPARKLTVSKNDAPQLMLTDASLTSNAWNFRSKNNYLYFATSSPSTFATSTTAALTVSPNGYLGVGTTTPGSILSIRNVANFTPATSTFYGKGLNLSAGCYAVNGTCLTSGSGTNYWTSAGGNIYNNTGTNVGIGTTTPGTLLSLGNTGVNTINISETATSTFGSGLNIRTGCYAVNGTCLTSGSGTNYWTSAGGNIYNNTGTNVGVGTTTPWGKLSVTNTGTGPSFVVEDATSPDSTPFIINASGSVGVGTASPGYKLDVNGDINLAAGSAYKYNGSNIITASTTLQNYFFGPVGNFTATGIRNLFIGSSGIATALTTGSNNIALGRDALMRNTTGGENISVGVESLTENRTGTGNTALGYRSLGYAGSATSTVAIGAYAGYGWPDVDGNQGGVYVGYQSGYSAASGSDYNTLVGYKSGFGVTSGARNVFLGQSTIAASYNQVTTGSNNISIGNDVAVPSATASNQLVIGNLIYGTSLSGTGATVSTGNIGIGTTTPWAKFSVNPASQAAGVPSFVVGSSTKTDVIITQAGNVGIGTTSPYRKLSITGNVGIDGNIQVFGNTYQELSGGFQTGVSFADGTGYHVTLGGIYGTLTSNATITIPDGLSGTSQNLVLENLAQTLTNKTLTAPLLTGGTLGSVLFLGTSGVITQDNPNFFYNTGRDALGLGTSTPHRTLTVASSTAPQLMLTDAASTGNTATNYAWNFRAKNGALFIATSSLSAFATSTISALTVSASGNLGVGVTAPTNKVDVAGSVNVSAASSYKQGGSTILFAPSSNQSSFVGIGAGGTTPSALGLANSVLGYNALNSANSSAIGNTAIGHTALFSNTNGQYNVALGQTALYNNLSGQYNTALGTNALFTNETSNYNTAVGANALNLATGASNIALGYQAAANLSSGAGNIVIGNSIDALSNTSNYQLNIGNLIFGTGLSGTGTSYLGNIGIGTTTPKRRLTIASSTASQLMLTDASLTSNPWNFRSAGGNLYFATSSPTTFATSTIPALTINTKGSLGIATSTPWGSLSINPIGQLVGAPSFVVGSSTKTDFIVKQNGFVGVGTTSPTRNFEVAGRNAGFNTSQDGTLSAWTTNSNSLRVPSRSVGSVAVNGYLFAFVAGAGAINVAKLNANGSVGAFATSTSALPAGKCFSSPQAYNGYIYVFGGSNCALSMLNTVYYAKVHADGSLGAWQAGTTLPAALGETAQATAIANGYVYFVGGALLCDVCGNSRSSAVYYAKLNADGSIGAWATASNSLRGGRSGHGTIAANGYLYAVGGLDYAGVSTTSVNYAKLNADGSVGAWVNAANKPSSGRKSGMAFAANGYLYWASGFGTAAVHYTKLNADGSLATWQTNPNSVPGSQLAEAGTAYANGYVYLVGGYAAAPVSTVYYSSVARVQIAGNLDLLGLTSSNLSDASGDVGGSIFAGNIYSNNKLDVSGNAQFWSNVGVTGALSIQGATTTNATPLFNIARSSGADLFRVMSSGTVGIGTSSPRRLLTLATSTASQLTLADGSLTKNPWNFRSINGLLYIATSSPSTFATSTTAALTINTNGYLGIGITTPETPLHVSGDSTVGNKRVVSLMRSVPTTDDATIMIGSFAGTHAHALRISIVVSDNSFSVAKTYDLTSYYSMSGVYRIVLPISDTGAYGGNDFVLEATQTTPTLSLRIRRVSGSTVGTAYVTIEHDGTTATTFTPDSTTSTSAITAIYSSTPLTQVSGRVGIGTTTPRRLLTLASSTASQLMLTDASLTNTPWNFRSAGGNLYFATSSPSTFATSTKPAFMIDKNGKIGIATSSPLAKLHIVQSATGGLTTLDSTYTSPTLILQNNQSTARGAALYLIGGTAASSTIYFGNSISQDNRGFVSWDAFNNRLSLGGAKMRGIELNTSTHDVTIPNGNLTIGGTTVNVASLTGGTAPNPGGSLCWQSDGDFVVNVNSNACLSSSESTKHSITPSTSGLDQLLQLDTYTYIYNGDSYNTVNLGFIAEQAERVDPLLVSHDNEGKLTGIQDYAFLALLTKSVQQINARELNFASTTTMRLDSLEERLAMLENGSVSSGSGSTNMFSTSTLTNALADLGITVQRGIAQFNTLVSRQFVATRDTDGTSSAASVTINAGNTYVDITNVFVHPTTKILVTFSSQVQGSWWVSEKREGSFKVQLSAPQPADVSFDYFLVQSEGQIAATTNATSSPAYAVTQGGGTQSVTLSVQGSLPPATTTPPVTAPSTSSGQASTTPPASGGDSTVTSSTTTTTSGSGDTSPITITDVPPEATVITTTTTTTTTSVTESSDVAPPPAETTDPAPAPAPAPAPESTPAE